MASVLASYAELPLERYRVRFTTTASLNSRFKSAEHLPAALLALLRTAERRPRPLVHVHLADGGSLLREGAVLRLARFLGLPTVATMHASHLQSVVADDRARLSDVLGNAHVVHALGPTTAALIRDTIGSSPEIVVVPNCVTVRRSTGPAGANAPRALFAGEISLRKGVDVLLEAWTGVRSAVPDAELLVLGKPRDVGLHRRLDGLSWGGSVPRQRVLAELDRCRVAVLPTRSEAQPMFVLEAMAAGRPVVTTPIAEIPGTVADVAGLVAVGDANALAAALTSYLSYPDRATTAGDVERRRAETYFSIVPVSRRVEEMYDEAIRRADHAEKWRRPSSRAS
ncbi:MAG: glycosyltransferase family 4 protein [Pseudonocardia sp.]|nr:glycosyltransferase family 4 protein [Pseudonocardia sp.]